MLLAYRIARLWRAVRSQEAISRRGRGLAHNTRWRTRSYRCCCAYVYAGFVGVVARPTWLSDVAAANGQVCALAARGAGDKRVRAVDKTARPERVVARSAGCSAVCERKAGAQCMEYTNMLINNRCNI